MMRNGQLILTTILLVSAGALGFGLLSQQQRTLTQVAVQKAPATIPDQVVPDEQSEIQEMASEPVPLSEFVEMTMRPLFSPSRRPPPGEPLKAAPDSQPEIAVGTVQGNQFMVTGIVITPQEKVALLKQVLNSSQIIRVKEGQKLSDWTVAKITPEYVTLQQKGVTDVIKLSDNVLSAAQKQKLVQQAKRNKAKAVKRERSPGGRASVRNNRQPVRRVTRQKQPNQRIGSSKTPQPTIRMPVR